MTYPKERAKLISHKPITARAIRAILRLYGLMLGVQERRAKTDPRCYRVDVFSVFLWPLRGKGWLMSAYGHHVAISTRRELVAALEGLQLVMPLH